jgi:hypothetical protein
LHGATRAMWSPAFPDAVAEMRRLAADGSDVVPLDAEDTLLYQASGVRPVFRYAFFLQVIYSQEQLQQRQAELLRRQPRYVVMRPSGAGTPREESLNFRDIWDAFHTLVGEHYARIKNVGEFEFWEIR